MTTRLLRNIALLGLVFLPLTAGACKKKTAPIARTTQPSSPPANTAPDTPPASAPVVSLNASPSSIEEGDQTTLSWNSSDVSSLVIDGGVGNVSPTGSIVISPTASATYTAVARGPGGEARASTRVTVLQPAPVEAMSSTDADEFQRLIESGQVEDIFFAYDKADLSERAKASLQQNARYLRELPQVSIIIEGHCDERGSEAYNLALGDNRALQVRQYLIDLGVEPERIDTISFGEERPFDTRQNDAAYAQNRRAHFVVGR